MKCYSILMRGSITTQPEDPSHLRSIQPDHVPPGGMVTDVPKIELPTLITSGSMVLFLMLTLTLFSGEVAQPEMINAKIRAINFAIYAKYTIK